MKTTIRVAAAIACAFALHAHAHDLAPAIVGAHLHAYHLERAAQTPGSLGWNDRTPGVYAIWRNGLTLGHVPRNSLYQRTTYAGWTSPEWAPAQLPVRASLTLGAATGYDRLVAELAPGQAAPANTRTVVRCNATAGCRPVAVRETMVPMVSVNLAAHLVGGLYWRASLLAKTHRDSSAAVLLSTEWRF